MITIAHRLNTINKCNKIILMEDGFVTDFDIPEVLINKKGNLLNTFQLL